MPTLECVPSLQPVDNEVVLGGVGRGEGCLPFSRVKDKVQGGNWPRSADDVNLRSASGLQTSCCPPAPGPPGKDLKGLA